VEEAARLSLSIPRGSARGVDQPTWTSPYLGLPRKFSPRPQYCFAVNKRRLCRFSRLFMLVSVLLSIACSLKPAWHGRGHRFDPDQVHKKPFKIVWLDSDAPPWYSKDWRQLVPILSFSARSDAAAWRPGLPRSSPCALGITKSHFRQEQSTVLMRPRISQQIL